MLLLGQVIRDGSWAGSFSYRGVDPVCCHLTPIAVHIGRADQLCYRGDDETTCIALD